MEHGEIKFEILSANPYLCRFRWLVLKKSLGDLSDACGLLVLLAIYHAKTFSEYRLSCTLYRILICRFLYKSECVKYVRSKEASSVSFHFVSLDCWIIEAVHGRWYLSRHTSQTFVERFFDGFVSLRGRTVRYNTS
jgi:hypothetical protein